MKNMTRKFLAAGLLASALTFVGCKSDTSADRKEEPTQTQPADTTEGTTTTPAEGTGTPPTPGTGGSGTENISKTKQSDDNLRMPYEDPLRTKEDESIKDAEREDAEREDERGVHDRDRGTGGAGFENEATDDLGTGGAGFGDDVGETPNEGGNFEDTDDSTLPRDNMINETQIPEGTR